MDLSHCVPNFPADMSEYFSSRWTNEEIWQHDAPLRTLPMHALDWHLDYPFLSSHPPQPLFDLKPRDVLNDHRRHPAHWRRVEAADLRFPIVVTRFGGRIVILDGIHRLMKSVDAGALEMECKVVARHYLRTVTPRD